MLRGYFLVQVCGLQSQQPPEGVLPPLRRAPGKGFAPRRPPPLYLPSLSPHVFLAATRGQRRLDGSPGDGSAAKGIDARRRLNPARLYFAAASAPEARVLPATHKQLRPASFA